ncbi:enoyl-CoA hydratase/isomerase family protein [Marinimicrobium sp. ARAG 43.8]|uniref:enoyl-CoA hydratase/isomerase family protein n=1 Tax=Marinimicrobium sp. ARAG 43.8 TaxID=3418719 RepID=UPI003CEBC2CB
MVPTTDTSGAATKSGTPTTADSVVSVSVAQGVAQITLNRPPANAYNLSVQRALYDAVADVDQRSDVLVAVLRSASDRFFCAGADIKEFQSNSMADNQAMVEQARRTLAAMERSGVLFIAQIGGHALGGGLELAMACDVRFAARGSYRLGLTEIKLGLIPGNGGTQRLTRLVGMPRALELLASGDPFGVEEAARWGLINRLYESEALASETMAYAERVAAGPALALAASKRAVRDGGELPLAEGLATEQALADGLYDTRDAEEGFQAFLEKRTPHFTGR